MPRWIVLQAAVVLLAVTACVPPADLAVRGVEEAVRTNNAAVVAMRATQEGLLAARRAAMISAARTAQSKTEGRRALDQIDARFAPVFATLVSAEKAQAALAEALVLARQSAADGADPNISELLQRFGQVQKLYSEALALVAALKGGP